MIHVTLDFKGCPTTNCTSIVEKPGVSQVFSGEIKGTSLKIRNHFCDLLCGVAGSQVIKFVCPKNTLGTERLPRARSGNTT